MQRYEAAGFNPARMNPRSWVDDAQPPRPGYRPVTPTTRARSSPGTAPRRAATERATHFFLRSGSRHAIRLHPDRGTAPDGAAAWGAVLAMSLGAFALVASEFMPVSLLTPIAGDLHVSEGQAGQAISVSGAFALVTSLFIASLAGRRDRKPLLLVLTLLTIVSGTLVAFAPNYAAFIAGRALIGVAIGGFWSMSAATAMRLVPAPHVPRALAIVNGGNALATVVAAPLGSFLGGIVGWRWAFFCVVPVAAIAFGWKLVSLPSMQSAPRGASANALRLLARPPVALGMAAVSVFFMGQFTLFTYLRPFLETVTHAGTVTLSLLLLVIGVAGFAGTFLIGGVLERGNTGHSWPRRH